MLRELGLKQIIVEFLRVHPVLKPMHNIGKVSVNASIHKAITHYW